MFASLWIVSTISAAGAQALRNALQRGLTVSLGTLGATHVRFLFGLPFSILFLALAIGATGAWPAPSHDFLLWAGLGGLGQIAATACMLHAMRDRSFLVTIALTKTEPVQVALFGIAFLGEVPGPTVVAAIVAATVGVLVMSWPKPGATGGLVAGEADRGAMIRAAGLGIAAGGFFGIAAVFFKKAILASGTPHFLVGASTALVGSLAIQTAVLTAWLVATDRRVFGEIFRQWKPSVGAGFLGAFASQCWFVGFATAPVAAVRTLGLVEIFFAQVLSRSLMKERPSKREIAGIGLLVLGVVLVLRA
jgi:drug/metabolite transporter (DMT)-like permease